MTNLSARTMDRESPDSSCLVIPSHIQFRVNGERYFTCRQNYGVFVRPNKVNVGDFPVEEIDLDEEM
jgi:hypothetical protein